MSGDGRPPAGERAGRQIRCPLSARDIPGAVWPAQSAPGHSPPPPHQGGDQTGGGPRCRSVPIAGPAARDRKGQATPPSGNSGTPVPPDGGGPATGGPETAGAAPAHGLCGVTTFRHATILAAGPAFASPAGRLLCRRQTRKRKGEKRTETAACGIAAARVRRCAPGLACGGARPCPDAPEAAVGPVFEKNSGTGEVQ